jgi:hypothetical protein
VTYRSTRLDERKAKPRSMSREGDSTETEEERGSLLSTTSGWEDNPVWLQCDDGVSKPDFKATLRLSVSHPSLLESLRITASPLTASRRITLSPNSPSVFRSQSTQ